jgi:hypothetical protein
MKENDWMETSGRKGHRLSRYDNENRWVEIRKTEAGFVGHVWHTGRGNLEEQALITVGPFSSIERCKRAIAVASIFLETSYQYYRRLARERGPCQSGKTTP